MKRNVRPLLLAAALAASGAHAQVLQTQIGVAPALQVQQLAPQLVAFAGGQVNFENLVNGLALGLPVTLTTAVQPGITQVVSFTPAGVLSAGQIAQTLENARQLAIANGIAAPTAQQLGAILGGGTLPTASGTTTLNGLITGTGAVTSSLTTTSTPGVGTPSVAAQMQSTRTFSRSDSALPRGIADSPGTVPLSTSPTLTPSITGTAPATVGAAPTVEAPRVPAAVGGTAPAAGATAPAVGAIRGGRDR